MAGSDITVSSLVAVPRVQGNKLAWAVTDPWPKDMSYSLGAVEVWGSTTNDRAGAAKVGEGQTDYLHPGLSEEATWYYWIKARNKVGAGSYGAWHPVSATAGVSSRTLGQAGNSFVLTNGKIVATVALNVLTIAVKTLAGSDPSAADPVYVAFRNATLNNGSYTIRTISSALSLTVSNGSTLGVVSTNQAFRIWIVLFDDGGTPRLAVFSAAKYATFKIYQIDENGLQSAVAEGGAGAADSVGIYYASVTITAKPVRIIAYCEWTTGLTTAAGQWTNVPDIIQMYGPGILRPSQPVQHNATYDASVTTGTTIIPFDTSNPLVTEGDQYLSLTYTMASLSNFLDIEFFGVGAFSVPAYVTVGIFHNAPSSLAAGFDYTDADQHSVNLHAATRIHGAQQTGTPALSITFYVRIGGDRAGTFTFNGIGGANKLGGTPKSMLRITEIKG